MFSCVNFYNMGEWVYVILVSLFINNVLYLFFVWYLDYLSMTTWNQENDKHW